MRSHSAKVLVTPAHEWRIGVGDGEVSAVFDPAALPDSGSLFVCSHGAGGNMSDRGLLALSQQLRSVGLHVVRFNFPYRERNRPRPDPMPRLKECVAAVARYAREQVRVQRLIIGGRSMGGRAASMLAADGFGCDGLLLLAYPLHPAGQPERLRDEHLSQIRVPVLCFNGTRDALCLRDLMDGVVRGLGRVWNQHWLEAADHSFHVTKGSGRSDAEVLSEVAEVTRNWEANLSRS